MNHEAIRARREALKLTQKTAAQLAGVTEPTWQRFETGGKKIAPYLAGLPPERLRKVWAEWELPDGRVYEFKQDTVLGRHWDHNEPEKIELECWHDWKLRPHGATWAEVEAKADAAEKPAEPKMLDLTKLPPGTVCEALEDIPRWNGRTIAAGVRFTLRDTSAAEGDEFPMVVTTNGENTYCIPALVPARVVKEGGEDAPR